MPRPLCESGRSELTGGLSEPRPSHVARLLRLEPPECSAIVAESGPEGRSVSVLLAARSFWHRQFVFGNRLSLLHPSKVRQSHSSTVL
ncbi:hypothetical protein J6590_099509 [Homalodisca vitripennis]|nr:hypothetical protein J6590_099509 [Homalodisca vitripennis]